MNIFCRMTSKLYTGCPLNQDNSPIITFPTDGHFGLKRCFTVYNDMVVQRVLKKFFKCTPILIKPFNQ